MHEVKNARYVDEYILEIEFEDGKKKKVDFESISMGKFLNL